MKQNHRHFYTRSTLLLAACAVMVGCGPSKEEFKALAGQTDVLVEGQAKLDAQMIELATAVAKTSSPTVFQLYDASRDKTIGYLRGSVSLSKGDRVFFGDDIWDVNYVKIFTSSAGRGQDGSPMYHTSMVQLLVSFGGKAVDPKK